MTAVRIARRGTLYNQTKTRDKGINERGLEIKKSPRRRKVSPFTITTQTRFFTTKEKESCPPSRICTHPVTEPFRATIIEYLISFLMISLVYRMALTDKQKIEV